MKYQPRNSLTIYLIIEKQPKDEKNCLSFVKVLEIYKYFKIRQLKKLINNVKKDD